MFSLKFIKIFFFAVLFASACRFWQSKPDAPLTATAVEELKSDVPFAAKEPEVFQTEIHVSANGVENVIFEARDNERRLTIYDYREKSEFSVLQLEGGKTFTLARNQKIYAENQAANNVAAEDDFPTAELLNQEQAAKFEAINAEDGFAKYLVRLNESGNSEIVITVDEKINLPVKQEFYSVSGAGKTLLSTTELKNFTPQADAENFQLPKDYKKVSPVEFQEILRRERGN